MTSVRVRAMRAGRKHHADFGAVTLEPRGFEFLDAVSRALRPAQNSVEREFEGRVVRLADSSDDDDANDDDDRVATLRVSEQGRTIHARMRLQPEDYRRACDAHRDGVLVRVRGRLERAARLWWLMGAEDLRRSTDPTP